MLRSTVDRQRRALIREAVVRGKFVLCSLESPIQLQQILARATLGLDPKIDVPPVHGWLHLARTRANHCGLRDLRSTFADRDVVARHQIGDADRGSDQPARDS